MAKNQPLLWGYEEDEWISCETLDEAVEKYIADWEDSNNPGADNDLTIVFYQYSPMAINIGVFSPVGTCAGAA